VPRGRQYYDPIIQAPSRVETGGEQRIELYPEHDVRDNAENPRWVGRLIGEDGLIKDTAPGSFDHGDALRQAQGMWPGLQVFELREESEDSTWDGVGPSPRLWQNAPDPVSPGELKVLTTKSPPEDVPPAVVEPPQEEVGSALHAINVERTGVYVNLYDLLKTLEGYAVQFDSENNPSAALGLREAASALREAF
jgi:hypothetical protein